MRAYILFLYLRIEILGKDFDDGVIAPRDDKETRVAGSGRRGNDPRIPESEPGGERRPPHLHVRGVRTRGDSKDDNRLAAARRYSALIDVDPANSVWGYG